MARWVLVSLAFFPAAAWAGLRYTEEPIHVQVQRPEVEYLTSRQNLTPTFDLDLKETFLPRMIQSVNARVF